MRRVIASVSQLRASAKSSGIAFPAASTVRSNCRPHAEQVNVCRSYSRAFSAAGDRRVRNVRLPQFAHGGLSCAPKPRAIRTSSIMTGPPTRFRIRSGHANVSIEGLVNALLLREHTLVRLLRPRIVASNHSAAAIAKNYEPIRVAGNHRLVHPTGNIKPLPAPSLRGRAKCVRFRHVVAPLLPMLETANWH
jgi:hypothetical protein